MPTSLPKIVSCCLGITKPNDNSPPSSESASLAGDIVSVSHRAQTASGVTRDGLPLATAAAGEPAPGASGIALTTMAADWRGSELSAAGIRGTTGTAGNRGAAGNVSVKAHTEMPIRRREHGIAPQALPPTMQPATKAWVDMYCVNTSKLMDLNNEFTRYGLIELGGHRFMVGPTAGPAEARVLTRILKARPQIGAIFCVEPGAMCEPADPRGEPRKTGYAERPIHEYFSSVVLRHPQDTDASAKHAPQASVGFGSGLSHVQYMEFAGMERFDAEIPREVLWHAGRGVATFMRENPGKIALVCSERGIARPCAVIASAALQLKNGDAQLRKALTMQVVEQRSRFSDHHINLATRSLDQIAEFARLLQVLRSPGRGDLDEERKVHLLKARLPEATVGQYADVDWASDEARRTLATLLEDNFAQVSPVLASGGLPPDTALLWLCDEFHVQRGVRFLTADYLYGHIDRISQESIDPGHRNAVRLVTVDDEGLTCDNKYYDAAAVADWYRQCRLRSNVMSNPLSRAPVVALLVRAGDTARLEPLFRPGAA